VNPNRTLPRIMHGEDEPIFQLLPETVLANLRQPASENALLWNILYPLARPTLSLGMLLDCAFLWGTAQTREDELTPYFWGFDIEGSRLEELDEVLALAEGPGPKTEVDLFLRGKKNLILVEAKNRSGLGQCARYRSKRCPEVDPSYGTCIYWTESPGLQDVLRFEKPLPADEGVPACSRHYQLARTLLLGERLARRWGLDLHVWLFLPAARWRTLLPAWHDLTDHVRESGLWRNMRVIAWEELQALSARRSGVD